MADKIEPPYFSGSNEKRKKEKSTLHSSRSQVMVESSVDPLCIWNMLPFLPHNVHEGARAPSVVVYTEDRWTQAG